MGPKMLLKMSCCHFYYSYGSNDDEDDTTQYHAICGTQHPLELDLSWKTNAPLRASGTPIVSIVVPFFGFTNCILRILRGTPKEELQWRL